jgi:hypothetical protein
MEVNRRSNARAAATVGPSRSAGYASSSTGLRDRFTLTLLGIAGVAGASAD